MPLTMPISLYYFLILFGGNAPKKCVWGFKGQSSGTWPIGGVVKLSLKGWTL